MYTYTELTKANSFSNYTNKIFIYINVKNSMLPKFKSQMMWQGAHWILIVWCWNGFTIYECGLTATSFEVWTWDGALGSIALLYKYISLSNKLIVTVVYTKKYIGKEHNK